MTDQRQFLVRDGQRLAEMAGRLYQRGWSIEWHVLRGGVSEGVEVVRLANGAFCVDVCPTRGMGVLNAECGGTTVGWKSPIAAPVHPQFVNLQARHGLGWLDGFTELLCRCGLSFNGPPGNDPDARSPIESDLTLHGRIANTPAHTVEVGFDEDSGHVWISGECRESTLFGPNLSLHSKLSLPLDALCFHVEDTVVNRTSSPAELQLLYHINIGSPFLDRGAQFLVPFAQMSPRDDRAAEGIDEHARYLKPTPGYAEQVYFYDVLSDADGWSTALLHNHSGNLGVSVRFDRQQLPCLSQWKCTQPEQDGYVTGIEPGTNYPNFKAEERAHGRVVSLAAGESYVTRLSLEVHPSTDAVESVTATIARLQQQASGVVHPRPTQLQTGR